MDGRRQGRACAVASSSPGRRVWSEADRTSAVRARAYSSFMHDESRPFVREESRPTSTGGTSSLAGPARPLASVSDDDLLRRLAAILAQSRRVEADLVVHVAEVDARRLYAREAFSSMFAYCTEALHLSESEAYLRIAVARASREHPVLLVMLGDGRLHLSGIALPAPHLTPENREKLLRRATHRSKREIEELIAELAPREDVPSRIRKQPERTGARAVASAALVSPSSTPSGMGRTVTASGSPQPAASASAPPPVGPAVSVPPLPAVSASPAPAVSSRPGPPQARPLVEALAPGRYKVQFTASAGLREKLKRLQALLRAQVPDGDLGAIIEVAVTEKLERLEARRFAMTRRPRQNLSTVDTSPDSRHIFAPVRRAVRQRDGNRCCYVDAAGRRCEQRDRLEYHHLRPFGLGGDHRPENLRLMCRAHNAYLAEREYGQTAMERFRRAARRTSGPPALLPPGPAP